MGGENGLFEYLTNIAINSAWIETLQPYTKDLIQNYLMRGRDTKNASHVKTCARSLAKKITVFQILTCTVVVKNDKVDLQKTFSEFVTNLYFNMLTLILNSGPTPDFRSSVLSLWDESLLHLFKIFQVCFPNNENIAEIFAQVVIDEYFVGMPSIFIGDSVESLKTYFITFASKAQTSDLKPEISFKSEEDTVDGTVVSQSSNNVPVKTTPVPSSSSSSVTSPTKVVKSTPTPKPVDSGDADLDNLLSNLSLNKFAKQMEPSRNDASSDSPLKYIPPEWSDIVEHDIRRQLGMEFKSPSMQYLRMVGYRG